MKDWHKLKPELKKKPYHLPGCDTSDIQANWYALSKGLSELWRCCIRGTVQLHQS